MIFNRTDCVPSNLIFSCHSTKNLTVNLFFEKVNKQQNVIGTNVLNIKETKE